MANPPTTLNVTYGTNNATQTVSIPAGSNYSDFMMAIARGGGVWYTSTSGVLSFIPLSQISGVTAA